jgi:hypothetical protein
MSRLARKMTTTAMAVGFAVRRTWQPANMADETRTATPHPWGRSQSFKRNHG